MASLFNDRKPRGDHYPNSANAFHDSVGIDLIDDDGPSDDFDIVSPWAWRFSSMASSRFDRSIALLVEDGEPEASWNRLPSPAATRLSDIAPTPQSYVVQSLVARQTPSQPQSFNRRMSLQELHHLKDMLVKTSHDGRASMEGAASSPRSKNLPDTQQRVPLRTYFIPVTRQISTEKNEYLSSPVSTPSHIANETHFHRESIAVLIDTVRASAIADNDKCRFLFDLFDVTKSGVLSREGVAAFIEATLVANSLQCNSSIQVHEIVDNLFANGLHEMNYHEFRRVYATTIASASQPTGLHPPSQLTVDDVYEERAPSIHFRASNVGERKDDFWTKHVTKPYHKYDAEVHYLAMYGVIMVAAFVSKACVIPYDTAVGNAARVAKGFAQIILVNTLFVLLPTCRYVVTSFRTLAYVTRWVPIDKHIDFHKVCGVVLLLAALGHTVAWVFIIYYLQTVSDDVWRLSRFAHLVYVREESVYELMQRVPMWSGFVMLLLAAVAAPLTQTSIRQGNFNAFWLAHLLLLPLLLLIAVHGLARWVDSPRAFYWVLPPCVVYAVEKWYRRSHIFSGKTAIQRAVFSQDTVAIYLHKPASFTFRPGMYVYVKVPSISRLEWHPFTISSAPEDDFISIHVRKAGDWTSALHCLLRDTKSPVHRIEGGREAIGGDLEAVCYPSIFIDGPIGAPSQDYYRYKSVVFIGAGIGVTPFASILRSIVHQWEAYRCPCCGSVSLPRQFRVQKIYFLWVTREQEALAWFAETMNQLNALDTDGRMEIHTFYTPITDESVAAPLRAVQTFVHDAEGEDIISGLKTKHVTRFGRPVWRTELGRIADAERRGQDANVSGIKAGSSHSEHLDDDDIGVFFCGPKSMGREIHNECEVFSQKGGGVAFDFRSENF